MHQGEIGLFLDTQVFDEEWATINQGVDVTITATQSRNVRQFRLFWALAKKIADSGVLGDADSRDVVNYLLLKCKHVRYVTNKHRDGEETTPIVKSIRFAQMDQTEFNRLFQRALYIVTSEILPEMPDGELRAEVEKMAGVDSPEPEQKPRPQRRRRTAEPEKVSVIPADDSVPGAPADAQPAPASADKPASSESPPAAQDRVTPAPVAPPKNVQGWKDYCKAWLDAIDEDDGATDVDVLTKWNSETKLRNGCGVTGDDRQQLFAYMNAIVEKKREAQAKRTA